MTVIYDKENNRLITIPDYLVNVKDGRVYISKPNAIWKYCRKYVSLGAL